MKCNICEKEFNKLFIHLKSCHNISSKEYYDKYIKGEDEGNCIVCSKQTKFESLNKGYKKYCSSKCVGIGTKNKREKTCLKKYGVNNIFKIKDFHNCIDYSNTKRVEKIKNTKKEKFGNENYNNRRKSEKTCLIKYGVKNPLQVKSIRNKHTTTNRKNNFNKLSKLCRDNNLLLLTNKDEFIDDSTYIKIKCHKGHSTIVLSNNFLKRQRCPKCSMEFSSSVAEKEIRHFLKENNIYYTPNNRNKIYPLELDLFLPEYNIAIEYNGLYWHNDEIKDKKYHYNKTIKCKNEDIQLLQIFEDEWRDQQDIVKSIILSKCGKYKQRIYARKCFVKEITKQEKKKFLNNNHLQGDCISSVNVGLYYNEDLMAVMTFGRRKITNNIENELLRYCSKKYTQIIGGASKLFKYYINTYRPNNIISYADRRYSNGNMYYNLGFKLKNISDPNYWYFNKTYKLKHRSNFQKHKLSKLLDVFDSHLSEYKNMKNNGFKRIWDCGNYVFEYIT